MMTRAGRCVIKIGKRCTRKAVRQGTFLHGSANKWWLLGKSISGQAAVLGCKAER